MSYLSLAGARIFYKKLGSSGVPLLFIHSRASGRSGSRSSAYR
jgi:hypothetical protein